MHKISDAMKRAPPLLNYGELWALNTAPAVVGMGQSFPCSHPSHLKSGKWNHACMLLK